MKPGLGCRILLALAAASAGAAMAGGYYDCAGFEDRALCKQLNRYPAVKDLPVFEAARVLELYRTHADYAEDTLEDQPLVLWGRVRDVREEAGELTVWLDGANDTDWLTLHLFALHPEPGRDGRIAGLPAAELAARLKPGERASFQCVGDGLGEDSQPVFRDCISWR